MSRNVVKKSGMRSKSQLTGQKMSTGAAGQQLNNLKNPGVVEYRIHPFKKQAATTTRTRGKSYTRTRMRWLCNFSNLHNLTQHFTTIL